MLTITEALAEIKTINKRIDNKTNGVMGYLFRQDGLKDPLEKEGGSFEHVRRERQGVSDLFTRIVALRSGITKANEATMVKIGDKEQSISDWLTWRRDVAPKQKKFLNDLQNNIKSARQQATKQGVAITPNGVAPEKPSDFVMNINEKELVAEIDSLENVLGTLDGILSLKNATTFVNV